MTELTSCPQITVSVLSEDCHVGHIFRRRLFCISWNLKIKQNKLWWIQRGQLQHRKTDTRSSGGFVADRLSWGLQESLMKVWRTHWGVWCHVEKQKEIKRFKNHSRIEKTYCPEREPEERHEQRRSVPSWYAVHQEAAIIWNDNTWEVNAVSTFWKARVLWIGRVHNAPQSTEVLCNMNSIDELNWCTELETILNDPSEDDSTETEQHAYSVLQWHRVPV